MKYTAPFVISLTLVAAACGQREGDVPVVPTQPAQDSMQNVPKSPPPPADPAPTSTQTELPKPGQNNDHSSPAFKEGGASVPQK